MLQLTTCCRIDNIGEIFCAPLDTGSTITVISKAASVADFAGNLMTLKYHSISGLLIMFTLINQMVYTQQTVQF